MDIEPDSPLSTSPTTPTVSPSLKPDTLPDTLPNINSNVTEKSPLLYNPQGEPNEKIKSNAKLEKLKEKKEEIKIIVTQNLDKAIQRDDKLDQLTNDTDRLSDGAVKFNTQAKQFKRQMWWTNCKNNTLCTVFLLVIIGIIVAIIIAVTKHKN